MSVLPIFPLRPTVSVMGVTYACPAGSRSCTVYSVHRKVSIVYRVPDFLCCYMNWGHQPPPPPPQANVGELYCTLYIQGVERQRGGGAISHGKGGSQIIRVYDSTETMVLFMQCSLYSVHPSYLYRIRRIY